MAEAPRLGGKPKRSLSDVRAALGVVPPLVRHTLVAADGQTVTFDSAGPQQLVVPKDDGSIPYGGVITIKRTGAGNVQLVAADGVSIRNGAGKNISITPGQVRLLHPTENTWVAVGPLGG